MMTRMSLTLALGLAAALPGSTPPTGPRAPAAADTIHLEIGSPEVDGRMFPPHRARNRVYIGEGNAPVNTWTNELTVGDSAGVPVMRWITRGVRLAPEGQGSTWELLQTYHGRTMAPMAYSSSSSAGGYTRYAVHEGRVRGVQRAPGESVDRPIDREVPRLGFMASASDLVPMAVGLSTGKVMTAPVWGLGMDAPEERVFTVLDKESVRVEGVDVEAWKVEERVRATGRLVATWWLTDHSPYMVLGVIPLADGRTQRITGVDLAGVG